MHGLLDGLVDRLGGQPQQRAQAAGGGRAEVGDMVDAVLVQADALDQGDMDLVGGDDGPQQIGAGAAGVLGDGEQRRDVVARVGVVGRQVGVVVVEFAHRRAVGPGGPLGVIRCGAPKTEAPRRGARWAAAWARATATGRRSREATATEALSITRLTAMAALSGANSSVPVATAASFQASCSSRGRRSALGWTRT